MKYSIVYGFLFFMALVGCQAKQQEPLQPVPAAENTTAYFPKLSGKSIGLVVNHTSMVGNQHLVDTLLQKKIKIKSVFAPEHGFRGNADAGEHVKNHKDLSTGLPIISLYGKNKKPTSEQLDGIDLMVFDIQDVGVRFYTYISTMHYVMEACAEKGIPLLILDRPNPNGHLVDGPVLQSEFKSFVGMHPIPILHGLTVGELARMINGEGWLKNKMQCEVTIVQAPHYQHNKPYILPIQPSPNLPNQTAIYWYPSLCLFEGTDISVGRGTTFPFQVVGSPTLRNQPFEFTPKSIIGMSKYPKHENKTCFGVDLRKSLPANGFPLDLLIGYYRDYPDKSTFFNNFFNKLAGNATLQNQIKGGLDAASIKKSWAPELNAYKEIRKKYLLYPEQ